MMESAIVHCKFAPRFKCEADPEWSLKCPSAFDLETFIKDKMLTEEGFTIEAQIANKKILADNCNMKTGNNLWLKESIIEKGPVSVITFKRKFEDSNENATAWKLW